MIYKKIYKTDFIQFRYFNIFYNYYIKTIIMKKKIKLCFFY